jgi:hypothetical protein
MRARIREAGDVVLITGASAGLGLAVTRLLLDSDYRLIVTARRSSLPRLAEHGIGETERIRIRPMDVLARDQRQAVVDEAEATWGGVDVLINNAGVAYRSVVEHVRREERLAQMTVNFLAPMGLARQVLPSMRRKRRGRILNVSSVSGMMAMPTMAAYSASKWALEGATEALWYEVRPWNVRVSLVQPGFINSPSFRNTRYTLASRRSSEDAEDPYHAHYENMGPFIEKLMSLTWSTPERVARTVVRTMRRRRPPLRAPVTLDAHLFALLRRLLPRSLYHEVLYRLLPRVETWGRDPAPAGDEQRAPSRSPGPVSPAQVLPERRSDPR